MANNTKTGAIIIEGHIQGLSNTRSLGEAGIPVFVVDKGKCIAQHSKYCTKYFQSPDYDDDSLCVFLIDLAIKEGIYGWILLPSNDHAAYTISKNKKELENYYKIITPDIEVFEKIYDKLSLMRIAKEEGIPVPTTYHITSFDNEHLAQIKYPVVIKGRKGLTFYKKLGKKVFIAHNVRELMHHIRLIESKHETANMYVQELITTKKENKTISFTAFCVGGDIKTHWTGIKLREHPIQFGTATFAESTYSAQCYDQSVTLLKSLNYTGVCEIEYLFDPGNNEYKLIEINARTWLWVGLAKACGVDYAKIIYNYKNDLPSIYPNTYELDKKWINPYSDFIYSILAILRRKLSPKRYIGSLLDNNNVSALKYPGDNKPNYMYLKYIILFFRNR